MAQFAAFPKLALDNDGARAYNTTVAPTGAHLFRCHRQQAPQGLIEARTNAARTQPAEVVEARSTRCSSLPITLLSRAAGCFFTRRSRLAGFTLCAERAGHG